MIRYALRMLALRYMCKNALFVCLGAITRDWKVVVGIDIEGLPCSFRILTKY